MEKAKAVKESSPATQGDETISHRPDAAVSSGKPKCIGRFIVLGKLGEGAFGQVYRARDPQLERDVAIKVQKRGAFVSADERERFLREAKAAAAIQHPNICPIHEVNADGDILYIVMAYVPGASLADMLRNRKQPLDPKQSALIVRKLAQALHAAHCKGIVHRDLKPGNVLFDRERKDVLVTDFGLARRSNAGDAELTHNGAILGTPAYMSPEQARGDTKEIGPASDIYSLGVILYELLTGKKPFTGSIGDILGKVQHVAPEPPSKLKSDIDPRLEKICLKAMAKSPKERFGSMREFAFHLGEYLKDVPTGAIQTNAADKAAPPGPSEAAQMAEIIAAMSLERKAETKAVEQSQRKLGRLVLGVGGCLGLLMVLAVCSIGGVGGWMFWRGGSASSTHQVTVTLQNISHLHDNSVHYYLDGAKIESQKLTGPLKLAIGSHILEGKRDSELVESRSFNVEPTDDHLEIVTPITETDAPVGELKVMKQIYRVESVAISPDGQWILSSGFHRHPTGDAGDGYFTLWDMTTGKKFEHSMKFVETVAFAPKGRTAYLGIRASGVFPIVLEYDLSAPDRPKDLRRFDGKQGHFVRDLQVNRKASRLLFAENHPGTSAPNVVVRPLFGDKNDLTLIEGAFAGCFTPDSDQVIAGKGTEVHRFDIRSDKPTLTQTYKGHSAPINCVGISRDGKIVAAGTHAPQSAVRTWDAASGTLLQHFKNHGAGGVSSVHFSPDNRRLLTAGGDGIVRISDVQSGEEIYQTPVEIDPYGSGYITCAVFTPGGRRVVFGTAGGTIRVWQLPK